MSIDFDNTYATLPEKFYTRLAPEPVSEPRIVRVNEPLAKRLGFDPDWLGSSDGAKFAVGNELPEGADPIATVYAGHQFGNWVPRLGDGRAILVGEVIDAAGERFDVQLKGSGRTPYSRRGDGRSPLGPVLREYIISEAMAALGIPTTRSLTAASTGEQVRRERLLPGGVLIRVARSHIRVGTFEYFAGQGDDEAIRTLADYVRERHYPEIASDPMALFEAVVRQQAKLVAQWQLVGFIHGVMNTDNMLLSGETIDYGPCAFMNEYDPDTVYSSIDRFGRYAYGNQPPIAQWNLSRFAHALLQITDEETRAQEILDQFPDLFRDAYGHGMARKLGFDELREEDWPLIEDLLELMYESQSDYTVTFRRLTGLVADESFEVARSELPADFEPWVGRWQARLTEQDAPLATAAERMRSENPALIPRNHVVEAALEDAVERDDFAGFHRLVDALADPYEPDSPHEELLSPPRPEERIQATFCGT